MKTGIEVIIHDTEHLSDLPNGMLVRAISTLGARVKVDTGGTGMHTLKFLQERGIPAVALQKVLNDDGLKLRPEQSPWAMNAARVATDAAMDIERRIRALELKLADAQHVAASMHASKDDRINSLCLHLSALNRKVGDVELEQRNQRVNHRNLDAVAQELTKRVDARARVDARDWLPSDAKRVAQADAYAHGRGCQKEGDPSTADECIECEPVKREPLTANAGQPCPRTYPRDPLTAEDPCDDCGMDQRKHESAPFDLEIDVWDSKFVASDE